MTISKSQLEAAITEAIKELKNANDKHRNLTHVQIL